jgi:hypothetical protein
MLQITSRVEVSRCKQIAKRCSRFSERSNHYAKRLEISSALYYSPVFLISSLQCPLAMKLVLIGLSLALLLAFSAAEEQLRVMQEAGIKEMGIATASNIQKPSKAVKDAHYEQIMNYAYRRAAPSWLDPKFPTKKAPNTESCLQFGTNHCFNPLAFPLPHLG